MVSLQAASMAPPSAAPDMFQQQGPGGTKVCSCIDNGNKHRDKRGQFYPQ